jgi:hypothetical protein
MDELVERLGYLHALRNTCLKSLLQGDFSEPLTLDQIDSIEMLELEILANISAMQAMLETADAQ